MCKEAELLDPYQGGKKGNKEIPKMTEMMELADKNYKTAIKIMLKDLKETGRYF